MVQDSRGVLYFATNDGILEFDGRDWELIQSKGAIYSLLITDSGKIFWSGTLGFGTVGQDERGRDAIEYLSFNVADVFQSVSIQEQVYFVNDEFVFTVETESKKSTSIGSNTLTRSFTGIVELFGAAYVTTEGGGLFKVTDAKLEQTDLHLPQGIELFSSSSLDGDYIILASNNRVFHCNQDLGLKEITLEDQAYADASVVVSITWVNSQLIALGTLRGGVLFVNPLNGKTQEIVNYATGLPDNEVFAMLSDSNQSVWVAHDYGFSRIAPYIPFRSFSHYAGLNGNLLCALSFKNNVYVGTSLGLFKLVKEDIYDELVTYVDVEIKYRPSKTKQKTPAIAQTPVVEKQPEAESKKRGFFRFLRRKKDDKKVEEEKLKEQIVLPKGEEKKESVKPRPKYRKEKRIEKVLRSSQYAFQKVNGIDAKVTHLMEFEDRLIAGGLGGVYEVTHLQATSIINDPVRFVFGYKSNGLLLASTYADELRALRREKNVWNLADLFKDLDDQINFIFEGKENELWLAALDKVYRLEIAEQEVKNIQTILIANANLDETVGISWHDRIILTNANGFYAFNRENNSIVLLDSLPRPRSYFATGGNLWYRDNHRWNVLGSIGEQSNLQLLNLFQDLRSISSDQTPDNLWLVSRDNELFKFYGEKITPYERGYPVYLKSILSGVDRIRPNGNIEVGENNGPLSFTIVQPDYTGFEAIEYRYILKGLNNDWSDWSNANNLLDFAYLPPGKYNLQAQSKNIFGKVADMQPITFVVLAPYWKRSWFYALEFFVFAGLVILSYRLSTRYRFISRLLMLITIILLIEFIQTIAGATFASKESPVMDFFIQVGVALLILPVESYLRNLMLRSIGSPEIHPILRAKPNKSEGKG